MSPRDKGWQLEQGCKEISDKTIIHRTILLVAEPSRARNQGGQEGHPKVDQEEGIAEEVVAVPRNPRCRHSGQDGTVCIAHAGASADRELFPRLNRRPAVVVQARETGHLGSGIDVIEVPGASQGRTPRTSIPGCW